MLDEGQILNHLYTALSSVCWRKHAQGAVNKTRKNIRFGCIWWKAVHEKKKQV